MKRSLILIAFIVIQLIGFNTSGIPIVVNTKSTSNSNDSITIIPTVTDAICTATNGSISIEVEGGVPPYIFNWTGPDGFTSTNQNLSVLAEGNYKLVVTDKNGVSATVSIDLSNSYNEHTILPITTSPICNAENGAISIQVTGYPSVYRYSWNGPDGFTAMTRNIAGLAPGIYTVTVMDDYGCTSSLEIGLEPQTEDITLLAISDHSNCTANNGAISVSLSGGTPPYTFSWSGPDGFYSNTMDVGNLAPGNYSVLVTDYNGCIDSLSMEIEEINEIHLNQTAFRQPVCNVDGMIEIGFRGDTTGYKYSWTGPDGFTASTFGISGLSSGFYTCVITDNNGCTESFEFDLKNIENQPPIISNDTVSVASMGETSIEILSNDLDLDGTINLMSLKLVDGPLHGSIRFSENGNAIYTPRRNYIGPDIFSYKICDNGVPCGEECDIAYVYIDVQRDTIPPSFEGDLPDLNFECLSEVPDPFSTLDEFNQSGMVATDNFVIDPGVFQVTESSQLSNCVNTIFRSYTVMDFTGNTSTIQQSIVIEDTQDPTLKCPPNVALSLDHPVPGKFTTLDAFVAQGGSVIDNCEIDPGSFFNMSESIDTLSNSILIRRAYYVEDYCRNGDICLHQIEIETETNSIGLPDISDFHVSVYPNPSSGQFSVEVEVSQSSEVQFEIVDMNGKTVYNETHPCTTGINLKEISLPNIAQGTYMLKAKSGRGVVIEKVVVR